MRFISLYTKKFTISVFYFKTWNSRKGFKKLQAQYRTERSFQNDLNTPEGQNPCGGVRILKCAHASKF